MLNRCDFIGRVGKDPETKYLANGDGVTSLSIAVSETWKDKNGEKQERTEWVNVVFWKKLSEIVASYVHKGSLLYISGRLQTRKWQDKENKDRYTTEIVGEKMQMLSGKGEGGGKPSQQEPVFDPSDEVPF